MKPGIRRLIEELRGARVLVVHPRDAEGDALLDQLKRIGCNVRGIWPPPVRLPNDIDTVFHLVETAEAPVFVASASDNGPTFVAIVDYGNPTVLRRLLDSNAHGVINKRLLVRHPLVACARPLAARLYPAPAGQSAETRRDIEGAPRCRQGCEDPGDAEEDRRGRGL
jgi:hypothetical protein